MRKWWARSAIVWLGFVLAAGLNPGTGNADYGGGTIKIGVLNDQSGARFLHAFGGVAVVPLAARHAAQQALVVVIRREFLCS